MKLTRNQRRQMKKLAPHLGRIADADRLRLRLFVTNAEDAGTDVPEDLAGAVFDRAATPKVREIEAALRPASSKEGGAA